MQNRKTNQVKHQESAPKLKPKKARKESRGRTLAVLGLLVLYFLFLRPKRDVVTNKMKELPNQIIAGYAFECSNSVVQSVINGVNVVIWFSIDLGVDALGNPEIQRGLPDYKCIAKVNREVKDLGFQIVNLITVGGWNAKHPDTRVTPMQMYQEFLKWNQQVVAQDEYFTGFDGLDWDVEGNDDLGSEYNTITVECLDFMGEFSKIMKSNGFIMSMAPAESYLDPTTSNFDRSLLHEYPEWEDLIPPFKYHGWNTYAYIISRYGSSILNGKEVSTFDFITVQFYESYSHLLYQTRYSRMSVADSIFDTVQRYLKPWEVRFEDAPEINWKNDQIHIKPEQLVIGLANGWADNKKSLLLRGVEIKEAVEMLASDGIHIKGFAFWNIRDEGLPMEDGSKLYLARELKLALKP
jgi:chitinase